MARIQRILAVLSVLLAVASAYSPPTFCKCTCFTNSTIIPLGPQHVSDGIAQNSPSSAKRDAAAAFSNSPASSADSLLVTRASSSSCSQCNRAFCLDYNLPICKGAQEQDVVAMCFQRDSRKDQIVVWCFLLGTGCLLGWVAVQRILKIWEPDTVAGRGGTGSEGGPFQRLASRTGLGSNHRGTSAGRTTASSGGVSRGQYAPLDGSNRV
ncbi:hypothetical protein SEPCBS119000_006181 [Sporothrix epigloea]|uniref:MFS transporter n=1 Tax=Sporothrix epigloea TaxID=1892477 RepID=A0ABP0E530_9PEZI